MKTSLGIWAFGPMVTRFVPAGYQPQWAGQSTTERVKRDERKLIETRRLTAAAADERRV